MSLAAGCVRCSAPVVEGPEGHWACPEHGATSALWHPKDATYDALVDQLSWSRAFPTYLPWPMGTGWSLSDFATVADTPDRPTATLTCTSGTSELDGPVDALVITEEAGTGLGARCAGTRYDDPGADIGHRPPTARARLDNLSVNLWDISTSTNDREFDRSVLAGEAAGRWLWVVLRPASALLLLRDELILRDVSDAGPQLVEVPLGGPPPVW